MRRSIIIFAFLFGITSVVNAQTPQSTCPKLEIQFEPTDLSVRNSLVEPDKRNSFGISANLRQMTVANSIQRLSRSRKTEGQKPQSYSSLRALAVAYVSCGDYPRAIAPLQQALAKKPDANELWYYLGISYYKLKDFQKAAECMEKVVHGSVSSPAQQNNAGYAFLHTNRLMEAENAFQIALKLKPDMSEAAIGLCLTYAMSKETDQTITYCRHASQLDPTATTPIYFLGLAKLQRDQFEDALKFFSRGMDLQPDDPQMRIASGFAHFRLNHLSDALESYKSAAKLKPSGRAYNGMGVVYFAMHKYDKSVRALNQALELKPESNEARFNLGIACAAKGDRDCSLKQYNWLRMKSSPLADTLFARMFEDKVLDVRTAKE